MKEIYKFISDMASEKKKRELLIFEAKACQTEIGGINSANGEIGFEHESHEIPYEAKKVTVPMKRVIGSEGRASCYWRCDVEDGDLNLLGQSEGYVNFEGYSVQPRTPELLSCSGFCGSVYLRVLVWHLYLAHGCARECAHAQFWM